MPKVPILRAATLAAMLAAPAMGGEALPVLRIDLARTTVSGLSSGAYMAGQYHLAFSSEVAGAAIVAGGPYGCAEGRLELALERCMAVSLGPPDPVTLLTRARARAAAGEIDPLANLADDRVYLFSGTADRTVLPEVAATVPAFYAAAGVPEGAMQVEVEVAAGHGFATVDGPVACGVTGPPFVNDCDLDQAGAILSHLGGPLHPPSASAPAPTSFDQALYLSDPLPRGMAEEGRVYVPASCAIGETCRVHIVFHGCQQAEAAVGDAVTVKAGYNRWAETNRIVVLYPQAAATWSNPKGCWDWWGYTGQGYPTRDGVQVAAVHRMLHALAGRDDGTRPGCVRHEDWYWTHWTAGRAVPCAWGLCVAGSGAPLGLWLGRATVIEQPPGFFATGTCP
jgi:poly(3-hydroxybutyrate) depolymerase